MRSALIIGVSVLALGLGGCSWMERTTGIGGGSDQSAAQAEPAQPASSSAMSGTSQAPTPMPQQAQSTSATAGSGSSPTMHHHAMQASNEVRSAQQKLKDDGDYNGKIDGLAGPQTRQALMQYQKKNGLKQTGHLDHATMSKLGVGGGTAATSGSSMPPAPAANGTGGSSDTGSSGSSMGSSGSSGSTSPAPATGNGGNNMAAPGGTNSGSNSH